MWTKEGSAKIVPIPNITKRLTVKPSLYFDSNTDIAAREPDPIVANGNVSVDPWGYICRRRHYIKICEKLSLSGQKRHCQQSSISNAPYVDEVL